MVNENDTIATSEIKYGDNDRLASRVAQITNADTLILLSDVDGLYTKNPKKFILKVLMNMVVVECKLKLKQQKFANYQEVVWLLLMDYSKAQ